MSEQKRDAAADLAMCEAAAPGPWVWSVFRWHIAGSDSVVAVALEGHGGAEPIIAIDDNDARFIAESRTALPHWINRAVAAEAEVERIQKETEAIRYVVDMLDTGDPQQRRARLHLLEVIKRMEKA